MKKVDFYKKFGATDITRIMFEYSFKNPIDMDYVSDEAMEILAASVETYIRAKYPKVADELFSIWVDSKILPKEFCNKACDKVAENHKEVWDEYMLALEKMAPAMGGIVWVNGDDKKFGSSHITREMFEDCFENPIDMSEVSDEAMVALAISVENHMRKEYPDMVDKLFAVWVNDDPSDEEYDAVVTYKDGKMWYDYWATLEDFAIQAGGIVCESDDNDDNEDDSNPTAIATESFLSDMRILRLDIDDILDSLPYNKALTMRLRAIDRKLADIADDFSSLKATIDFLGEQR
jgi:hypothetical protein